MNNRIYYLVGAGRSGTISLAKILDGADNGICKNVPIPGLDRASRNLRDGLVDDPESIVERLLLPRAYKYLATNEHNIYGETQESLGIFIPAISRKTRAKFVYIHRDGREVMRSLMNWHNRVVGNIYRECSTPGNLSSEALLNVSKLPLELDDSDYSRPRPKPSENLHSFWMYLSREEMCAYYWTKVNEIYLENLGKIDRAQTIEVDYTLPDVNSVCKIIEFLELNGIEDEKIRKCLDQKVNSFIGFDPEVNTYPHWTSWDGSLRQSFWDIAGDMMSLLGYDANPRARWKPTNYGTIWDETKDLDSWYMWMFNGRINVHNVFFQWFEEKSLEYSMQEIADFGSGIGYEYSQYFSNRTYHGYDIAKHVVEWANRKNTNSNHHFYCTDYICEDIDRKYDLVISSGTIDNCYDIDQYLDAMVRVSRRWIYLTSYSGWFPELESHNYSFNAEQNCFYNKLSPRKVKDLLKNLGCSHITVRKLPTLNNTIPYETEIFAKVG
ncbi:MAG: class I SAM-dependent methyltransferase [Acidiferrobacterales bacterium]|nr:class I SAM-dependent methyltransferase [Acidiferrobacterales bacterium]